MLLTIAVAVVGCSTGMSDYESGGYYPGYSEDYSGGDNFTDYGENGFIDTAAQPNSTFSVDADGASYAVMRAYLNKRGTLPPAAAVRVEEMINYFTYDYPNPEAGHTVGLSHELTQCPWAPDNLLLRVGLKGQEIAPEEMPANNYVFMVDVSGSMNSYDKLDLLKEGLRALAECLTERDRVSLVTYSGEVKVLLEGVAGNDYPTISAAISKLNANGVTNGGDALVKAYELARGCYIEGGNNRVIIGTDGDFNVGMTSHEEIVAFIEGQLEHNIYLSVMGFGLGNLNDSMMEQMAAHGNGTYDYIDSKEQMLKVYINERSRLLAVAKDTKVQVGFNPEVVGKWRLVGYENRVMSEEDFEDTKKDAGEIGAGQTITALYELIPAVRTQERTEGGAVGELATCRVNYKEAASGADLSLELPVESEAVALSDASSEIKWAASVAAMGMLTRNSEYKGEATVEMVLDLADEGVVGPSVQRADPHHYRIQHLALLDVWSSCLRNKNR